MQRAKRHDSKRVHIEQLEERRLLTWGNIPDAMNLDLNRSATGETVRIVNLDAGINQDHTAFTGRLWTGLDTDFISNGTGATVHGWNFYDGPVGGDGYIIGNSSIEEVYPAEGGHGTQDASVMVNNHFTFSGDNREYEGIASGAEVITLKVAHIDGVNNDLNDTESGGIRKALDWVIAHRTQFNIVAVNMSLGVAQSVYTHATWGFQNQIATLANAGVVLATSAGNTGGTSYSQWPASDPNVITVGGWNQATNTITSTTSRGNGGSSDPNQKPSGYVDILAPGINVPIAGLGTTDYSSSTEQTSVAAPFITATGAILKRIDPSLTNADIRTILYETGPTVTADGVTGITYHRLDVNAAVARVLADLGVGVNGTTNDIEYDASGNLHMVWYNQNAEAILYSVRSSSNGSWSTAEIVDAGRTLLQPQAPQGTNPVPGRNVGLYMTMTLNSAGTPHVAYYESGNGDLRYATRVSGVCTAQVVEGYQITTGYYPSIKTAPGNNRPGISYYEDTHHVLKFAVLNGSSWEITTGAADPTGDVGRHSKNAIDGSNRWVIAYDDTGNGRAMYVRSTYNAGDPTIPTGWDLPTLIDDTASDVAFTDLAFDTNASFPAASYYDTSNGDLRLAYASSTTGGAGSWQTGAVLRPGITGLYTNLHYAGRNSKNQPAWDIIFHNRTTGSVQRARGATGSVDQYGACTGFTINTMESDGGAAVAAVWYGTGVTFVYSKSGSFRVSRGFISRPSRLRVSSKSPPGDGLSLPLGCLRQVELGDISRISRGLGQTEEVGPMPA